MKLRRWIRAYACMSAGFGRVAMLCIATLAVIIVLSARAAVAKAEDAMIDLGRHLMALSEAGPAQGSRGVVVNGQQVRFRVSSTEHDLETVMDFFDGWCRGGLGTFADQEAQRFIVNENLYRDPVDDDRSWRDLTMRDVDGDLGIVACIKHGIPDATPRELGHRLMSFLGSGNLRELGQFHFVAATRVGDSTRVVTVWIEGDFYPGTMFPAEGDAPGFDALGVSRPPFGRRMLSAGEIGHSETITMYTDTKQTLSELAVFYRRDILARGWRILADEQEGDDFRFFVAQRGGKMRLLSLSQEPGEDPSVTIATSQ